MHAVLSCFFVGCIILGSQFICITYQYWSQNFSSLGADYNRTIAPVPEKAVLKEKGKIGSYQHIKTWRSASGVDIVMYSI